MQQVSYDFTSFISMVLVQTILKKSKDPEKRLSEIGNFIASRMLEIVEFDYTKNNHIYILLQNLTFEFMPLLYKSDDRKVEKSEVENDEDFREQTDVKILELENYTIEDQNCLDFNNKIENQTPDSESKTELLDQYSELGLDKKITKNIEYNNTQSTFYSEKLKNKKEYNFLIHENNSPFTKYLSTENTFCSDSIIGGIMEVYLLGSGFKSTVSAHNFKNINGAQKTIYVIKMAMDGIDE